MTLFEKIIRGEIPSEKVFENDHVFAFKDIHPQAKIHVLFVHKIATTNVNEMVRKHPEQVLQVYQAIEQFTRETGLEQTGFRVVSNTNQDAGQTVFHTHFHVLAGEPLRGFGAR